MDTIDIMSLLDSMSPLFGFSLHNSLKVLSQSTPTFHMSIRFSPFWDFTVLSITTNGLLCYLRTTTLSVNSLRTFSHGFRLSFLCSDRITLALYGRLHCHEGVCGFRSIHVEVCQDPFSQRVSLPRQRPCSQRKPLSVER